MEENQEQLCKTMAIPFCKEYNTKNQSFKEVDFFKTHLEFC